LNYTYITTEKNLKLTFVLVLDVAFLGLSIIYHDMLIIFYTSGLWVEYTVGITLAVARSILLLLAFHFKFPSLLATLIGIELFMGVILSVLDVWVFLVTDCECLLRIDGALVRLAVRGSVLVAVLRLLR
jgi:hypothetical protein